MDWEEVWIVTAELAILFMSVSLLGTFFFFLIKETHSYAGSLLITSRCAIRGLCETANSSTTENWQWKTQMRAEQSRKRRRSRAVRDVLKLCALRGARTVSRGGSRSNTTLLPDRQSGGAPREQKGPCFSLSGLCIVSHFFAYRKEGETLVGCMRSEREKRLLSIFVVQKWVQLTPQHMVYLENMRAHCSHCCGKIFPVVYGTS